ncbi:protein of unknown function [Chitinophaga costaii]|uniref:DUF5005 domain-containing protein n=2 Tax=Chitinophaga costaii TaxID=1335309 RepID=A0A1C4AW98_9BACT|nr:protein of unknown function [Chitinophaga costaii]
MNKINLLLVTAVLLSSCMRSPLDDYKSQECAIISFKLPSGQTGDAEIVNSTDSATVTVMANEDLDLSSISPIVKISKGATVLPAPGVKVDFASQGNRYTYTVTSQAGSIRHWYVQVKKPEAPTGPRLQLLPNLGKWDPRVTVYSDLDYNDYLTRYQGWNGADGCYTVLLPDGRLLWSFQDSFFGNVSADRNRGGDNAFARNAAHLQIDTSLKSFIQLNPGVGNKSQTWIKYPGAADDQEWYWPGASQVHGNQLQMLLGHIRKTGSGTWDIADVSTDIALFDLPSMQLNRLVQNKDTSDSYNSGAMDAPDGYTYMYATENGYLTSYMYVARVADHDLTGNWEYYTGSGWSATPQKYNVCNNITQPNVFYRDGKYYLVSQQNLFGLDIYIQEASTPVGPWTNKRTLYHIPDQYSVDFISYNAFVHHALSRNGELVISYNINPSDFTTNFNKPGCADRYRPYFVRVFNWK